MMRVCDGVPAHTHDHIFHHSFIFQPEKLNITYKLWAQVNQLILSKETPATHDRDIHRMQQRFFFFLSFKYTISKIEQEAHTNLKRSNKYSMKIEQDCKSCG